MLTLTNEQLNRLWNLILKFDRISITSTDINIEDTDNNSSTGDDQFISIEKFYKLLINYHKLIELITIKNNELTIMKFNVLKSFVIFNNNNNNNKSRTHTRCLTNTILQQLILLLLFLHLMKQVKTSRYFQPKRRI